MRSHGGTREKAGRELIDSRRDRRTAIPRDEIEIVA